MKRRDLTIWIDGGEVGFTDAAAAALLGLADGGAEGYPSDTLTARHLKRFAMLRWCELRRVVPLGMRGFVTPDGARVAELVRQARAAAPAPPPPPAPVQPGLFDAEPTPAPAPAAAPSAPPAPAPAQQLGLFEV